MGTFEWLICQPPASPNPTPIHYAGRFFVVVRGSETGIYENEGLARAQMVNAGDYYEIVDNWSAAWRCWVAHCFHRHSSNDHLDVTCTVEDVPEDLSRPTSPSPWPSPPRSPPIPPTPVPSPASPPYIERVWIRTASETPSPDLRSPSMSPPSSSPQPRPTIDITMSSELRKRELFAQTLSDALHLLPRDEDRE